MNIKNLAMWAVIVILTIGLYNMFKNPQRTANQNNTIIFSEFLNEVENGNIDNIPAPKIAIDYWNLSEFARLKDVIIAVRDDEMGHRDVNHDFVKQIDDKKQVKIKEESLEINKESN